MDRTSIHIWSFTSTYQYIFWFLLLVFWIGYIEGIVVPDCPESDGYGRSDCIECFREILKQERFCENHKAGLYAPNILKSQHRFRRCYLQCTGSGNRAYMRMCSIGTKWDAALNTCAIDPTHDRVTSHNPYYVRPVKSPAGNLLYIEKVPKSPGEIVAPKLVPVHREMAEAPKTPARDPYDLANAYRIDKIGEPQPYYKKESRIEDKNDPEPPTSTYHYHPEPKRPENRYKYLEKPRESAQPYQPELKGPDNIYKYQEKPRDYHFPRNQNAYQSNYYNYPERNSAYEYGRQNSFQRRGTYNGYYQNRNPYHDNYIQPRTYPTRSHDAHNQYGGVRERAREYRESSQAAEAMPKEIFGDYFKENKDRIRKVEYYFPKSEDTKLPAAKNGEFKPKRTEVIFAVKYLMDR